MTSDQNDGQNPPVKTAAKERRRSRGKEDTPATENAAEELAAALSGIAAMTGVEIPGNERMAPQLCVQVPIGAFARASAQVLYNQNIFRRVTDNSVVTVDPKTGEVRAMTPLRYPSWSERFITYWKENKSGSRSVVSLSAELSAKVLASDDFAVKPLKWVNSIRLPAFNAERNGVELLPEGYHEGERTYTLNSVPYEREEMDPDSAVNFFEEFFGEFAFARPKDEKDQPLRQNRNFAVHMAAIMAAYCRHLYNGALRPAFIYQGNQPGIGKTLLATAGLIPVHGMVSVQAPPRDESELGKSLTTWVSEGRQFVILDNVRGYLASQVLEAFITSPQYSGRILGSTASITAENTMQVVVTGNSMTVSGDLARRSLLCDLFYAQAVRDRKIEKPISPAWLATPEIRAKFLAALWSLVSFWGFKKCPRSKGATLPSFEEFASIIGGIVMTAGFADPIEKPSVILDEVEQGWLTLLTALAEDVPSGGSVEYTLDDIIEKAKEAALVELLLGDCKNEKVALGKRLKRWLDRQVTDSKGRLAEFGHRHAAVGALYRVRSLASAPGDEDE